MSVPSLINALLFLTVFLLHTEKNQREVGECFVSLWTRSWTYQEPICKLPPISCF